MDVVKSNVTEFENGSWDTHKNVQIEKCRFKKKKQLKLKNMFIRV